VQRHERRESILKAAVAKPCLQSFAGGWLVVTFSSASVRRMPYLASRFSGQPLNFDRSNRFESLSYEKKKLRIECVGQPFIFEGQDENVLTQILGNC
jgi:hypothetical protein